MADAKVTTIRRTVKGPQKETTPLELWLEDLFNEGGAETLAGVVTRLLVGLVERDLLTVRDVIDITGEYNVFPAGEVPEDPE